jgi:alpha-L-fucosidase 2
MREILLSFLVITGLLTSHCNAQDNILEASKRKTRITAGRTDRAQFSGTGIRPQGKNLIWSRNSAKIWEEAYPVGNGKLGAMIFGGVADERLQLNENTVWDGAPLNPNNPEGLKAFSEIRRLLFENKNNEAVKLAEQTMMGKPKRIKSYQN